MTPATPSGASDFPISLDVESAPLAETVHPGDTVGKMRFLGMLVIPSIKVNGRPLSQLSDIAWDEKKQILYAVSDKGVLFHLRPAFEDDVLTDLELVGMAPLQELGSDKLLKDRRADAEGMYLWRDKETADAELVLSFERYPRIVRYRPDGHAIGEYRLPPTLADRDKYAHPNRMLEAVCRDTRFGILTMPEKPLDGEAPGYNRLYNLSGNSWPYPMNETNRITSLSCLGNGNVLVVEGNFGSRFWRSHVTLKRIHLSIQDGNEIPLQPETLFALESSKGYQIDNFEGIARHRGNRFFLVSDNNDFFLQRTLLMYFELLQ